MASRTRTFEMKIADESGAFASFFKKFTQDSQTYDFDSLSALRKLLSNEKAKILYIIKTKKPSSLYALAKYLKRDFKAVSQDIKLLERFGLIDMISEKTGKRERLKPILVIDELLIKIKV